MHLYRTHNCSELRLKDKKLSVSELGRGTPQFLIMKRSDCEENDEKVKPNEIDKMSENSCEEDSDKKEEFKEKEQLTLELERSNLLLEQEKEQLRSERNEIAENILVYAY